MGGGNEGSGGGASTSPFAAHTTTSLIFGAGCEQKHTRDWPDGGLASQSKLEIGRAADETAHHAPDAPLGANDGTLVFEP